MKLQSKIGKVAATAFVIGILGPSTALAGAAPKEVREHGTIKSINMSGHTLVVAEPNNKEQTFRWNDQTKFQEHSKASTPSALSQGERVHLAYVSNGDMLLLKRVDITPAKHQKPPSKSS